MRAETSQKFLYPEASLVLTAKAANTGRSSGVCYNLKPFLGQTVVLVKKMKRIFERNSLSIVTAAKTELKGE
jgi:hypothetical protein